ncbi:DUF58 domain-containing protein [Alteromonas confluentis]|uniref:DUF58 domain-containing protein n=1 Tax=Alteromonas confluentis TaxID=1656094 RepID=A0A1E7Z8Q4_9ALTE|nr:DUF58 domain-containing protein [Alteromonas confluentis]OFC69909.1 hypothetical protein BFC18_00445 [Alteromonas confluentis]
MAGDAVHPLIDAELIEQVQQFSLRIALAGKGGRLAEQKTSAKGQGLEFADYKPYVAGDELRAIDWHIYRRLGRLFVRVFEEQQNLPVYILLDHSASLFCETPSRFSAAQRCALALGAIALQQQDAVRVFPFAGKLNNQFKNLSGKHQLFTLAEQLQHHQPVNDSDITAALTEFAGYPLRKGLVIVISDFFNNSGMPAVLDALSLVKHNKLLIQVTQPWDADPRRLQASGDIRFEDAESAASVDLQLSPAVIKAYTEAYQRFNQQLSQYASDTGTGLLQLDASGPILAQLSALFEKGMVA